MTTLQHDPRTKQQIKDLLYSYLYAPVQKQFKNRIDNLIERNTLLGGFSHKSFLYKGTVYNCDLQALPRRNNKLIPQLKPDMDTYLNDIKHLNDTELPFVLGFINQVLNASDRISDYLRVLPESIHYPLEKFQLSCPCKKRNLTDEQVAQLKQKNSDSINLLKQRMVLNLLTT